MFVIPMNVHTARRNAPFGSNEIHYVGTFLFMYIFATKITCTYIRICIACMTPTNEYVNFRPAAPKKECLITLALLNNNLMWKDVKLNFTQFTSVISYGNSLAQIMAKIFSTSKNVPCILFRCHALSMIQEIHCTSGVFRKTECSWSDSIIRRNPHSNGIFRA